MLMKGGCLLLVVLVHRQHGEVRGLHPSDPGRDREHLDFVRDSSGISDEKWPTMAKAEDCLPYKEAGCGYAAKELHTSLDTYLQSCQISRVQNWQT